MIFTTGNTLKIGLQYFEPSPVNKFKSTSPEDVPVSRRNVHIDIGFGKKLGYFEVPCIVFILFLFNLNIY